MSPGSGARLVAVAASCLGAGIALGLAIPVVAATFSEREPRPDEDYVRQLADRYELSDDQARRIRMVLHQRDLDHRQLLSDLRALPDELRRQVIEIDRRAEERIKFVLTPAQRERFLRDSGPGGDPPAVRHGDDSAGKE